MRLKAHRQPGRKAPLYLAPRGRNPVAGRAVTVRWAIDVSDLFRTDITRIRPTKRGIARR